MRGAWQTGRRGVAAAIALLALAVPARAVEYRLQVASLFDDSYTFFVNACGLRDGAAGPGLDRLEARLGRGDLPRGAVLTDRPVQAVRESVAAAYAAARVIPEITSARRGVTNWDEVAWDGKPGEQSVWVVSPRLQMAQQLFNAALRGTGPMRNFQPFSLPMNGSRVTVLTFPLNFVWAQEERGTFWKQYLERGLNLEAGIAAVVGVNTNQIFADQVYLLVRHAEVPTTYQAVLAWRSRQNDRQVPGGARILTN